MFRPIVLQALVEIGTDNKVTAPRSTLFLRDVTSRINELLEIRGCIQEIDSRIVGRVLRHAFGLRLGRLTNGPIGQRGTFLVSGMPKKLETGPAPVAADA